MTSLLLAVILAAPCPKEKAKPDAAPSGVWVAEQIVQKGTDLTDLVGGCTLSFDGDTMTMRVDSVDHAVRVSFDPTAKVKEINLEYAPPAGPLRGIYKVEGDTLTICTSEKPGGPRPTEFKADARDITLF